MKGSLYRLSKKRGAILLYAVITLAGFPLSAKLVISESYQYYNVKANSVSGLTSAVNLASPIKNDGEIFHGLTEWSIQWRYKFLKTRSSCKLNQVETNLTLSYTMPQLLTDKESVNQVWQLWYVNLHKHELGHGDLAKQVAKALNDSLIQLTEYDNCKRLEKDANQLGYDYLTQLNEQSAAYDKKTNHGETQGAWLYQNLPW